MVPKIPPRVQPQNEGERQMKRSYPISSYPLSHRIAPYLIMAAFLLYVTLMMVVFMAMLA